MSGLQTCFTIKKYYEKNLCKYGDVYSMTNLACY